MDKNESQVHLEETSAFRGVEMEEKNEEEKSSCKSVFSSGWTLVRFAALCLVAIVILIVANGLKSAPADAKSDSLESVYGVGDRVSARDLWLIIELPGDSRGRRTRLGKKLLAHVCAAIKAGQSIGWTPLVVGGRSTCCRSYFCRHLHPADLEEIKHASSLHLLHERNDVQTALKTAAFLAANKLGAHFVFQANPEVYFDAGVSAGAYRKELERQLSKMTLGISVGLVKASPSVENLYHFDPYAHFSPDHKVEQSLVENGEEKREPKSDIIHQYKICEIKPPSLEKFLATDGHSLDVASPTLTLPRDVSAPFDSRNTLFAKDAFFALLLLHDGGNTKNRAAQKESYIIRSVVAQTLFKISEGSTKFSVASLPSTSDVRSDSALSLRVRKILTFTETWTCSLSTVLQCQKELVSDLVVAGLMDDDMRTLVDLWYADLVQIGYEDKPIINALRAEEDNSPCIGDDSLQGVYFHPTVKLKGQRSVQRRGKVLADRSELSVTELTRVHAGKMVQRLCPSVDIAQAMSGCDNCDRHPELLLIVTFTNQSHDYANIPLFEVIYKHHFQNVLYCGAPDAAVDAYMEHYNGVQGSYFSFLPTHTGMGYECLLGAIEMNYNVKGYMVVTEDTLINAWNFGNLDVKRLWHGNEHLTVVNDDNVDKLGRRIEDVVRSAQGILSALHFLEDVLLTPKINEDLKNDVEHHGEHGDHGHEHAEGGHHRRRRSEDEGEAVPEVQDNGHDDEHAHDDHSHHEHSHAEHSQDEHGHEEHSGYGNDDEHSHDIHSHDENSHDDHGDNGEAGSDDHMTPETRSDDEELIDESAGNDEGSGLLSIIEEQGTHQLLHRRNWHISLFGEIIQDDHVAEDPAEDEVALRDGLDIVDDIDEPKAAAEDKPVTQEELMHARNVTELLFHPANFLKNKREEVEMEEFDPNIAQFPEIVAQISQSFERISTKLNLWQTYVTSINAGKGQKLSEKEQMVLEQLQGSECELPVNEEICHLVADFFEVLQSNLDATQSEQGFRLLFDDLPVYYIPNKYKEKLYLLANLFTKHRVMDELAFPLLLRGLSSSSEWMRLVRAEDAEPTANLDVAIDRPQDLLSDNFELEQRHQRLEDVERAHYIFPVKMEQVLRNDDMRDVICRNF